MTCKRHENKLQSYIKAVLTYTGDDCGSMGPRFSYQLQNYTLIDQPLTSLASFLNSNTGKDGKEERKISEEVESGICEDFKEFLEFDEKRQKYKYIGPGAVEEKEPTEKPIWHKNPENFSKLVDLADLVMSFKPNTRVFSLGQSPAWVVRTAEMLSDARDEERTFGYIAFSGRFLASNNKKTGQHSPYDSYVLDSKERPENETKYREYLTSIGMDPDTIISKAAEGKKTVILEYTQSGESLASFVSVLYGWAKSEGKLKQLQESLDVCILAQDFCNLKNMNLIEQGISVDLSRIPVETSLIVPLANGEDIGPTSDRLVPRYAAWEWGAPMNPLENAEHIHELNERLQATVVKKVSPDIAEEMHEANQLGASPLVSAKESKSWTEAMQQRESKSKDSGVNHPW